MSFPFSFSLMIFSFKISDANGSKPAVGSSKISTSGLNRNAKTALTF